MTDYTLITTEDSDVHVIADRHNIVFMRWAVKDYPEYFDIGDGFIDVVKVIDYWRVPVGRYRVIEITETMFVTKWWSTLPCE